MLILITRKTFVNIHMVFWQLISFLTQSGQIFWHQLVSISVHPSFFVVINLFKSTQAKETKFGRNDSWEEAIQIYANKFIFNDEGVVEGGRNSFSRTSHRNATLLYCVTSWYVDIGYENKRSRVWKIDKKRFSEELAMEMNV